MQLEHASSSFYSPQERALVRYTTASAILDQVQSLATFEAFGTFKHTLRYGVVGYWFHWIFDSIWTLLRSFLKNAYQSANSRDILLRQSRFAVLTRIIHSIIQKPQFWSQLQ